MTLELVYMYLILIYVLTRTSICRQIRTQLAMKTLLFISVALILNLAETDLADFTKLVELSEELGSGKCSKSRFEEVMQEIISCQNKGKNDRTIANICSNNEKLNTLKCIDDNLPECWTIEGKSQSSYTAHGNHH